ncbi:MAG: hypothetical protein IJW45_00720 [Oscillospiraceae bacterium]|nr:hypothetical protein [Oscillospiraceae bacterium]
MLMRKSAYPIDYDKVCRQTVTVYRYKMGAISRTVCDRAYLDFRKNRNTDKTGSREVNSFLLVIPGETQAVYVEDKVLLGVGPAVEDWRQFIPANVPGLVVVKYVDLKYWGNKIVHTEAGG